MSRLTLPFDVMLFEMRRSMTWGRFAVWLLLVLFPVAIFTTVNLIVRWNPNVEYDASELIQEFGLILYFLVPEVTCLLGLLLWATPAISTEIEGQTWVYLTLRQSGRTMVLIGKYLTAVAWSLSAALLSVTACSIVIGPAIAFDLWKVLSIITVLSCVVHAALYVLIGTIFYRRTMVAAVFYTLVVEGAMSFVPALVNKATINYRLRGLLANWMEWEDARSEAENIFGSEPASTHLLALLLLGSVMLAVTCYRVERTEFPTQQEGG